MDGTSQCTILSTLVLLTAFACADQYVKHPCERPCTEDEPAYTCHYRFHVEWYYILSKACYNCPFNETDCYRPDCVPADGFQRPLVTVNRQMPGPSLQVCHGDRIVVDIHNQMPESTTTIHWHGHHQRGTPYMDGVPYVTQCPILPLSSFRYHYIADTPGTHFWHSHSGFQISDGASGPLIIRVPKSQDPHANLYDFDLPEHVILVMDWSHMTGTDKFVAHHHSRGNNKPDTILVNGRGMFQSFETEDGNVTHVPPAKFTVEQGLRYRFRLINSGFLNCPIEVSIDNHTMLLISSDGFNFDPIEADSLVIYAGERFDFVLNATAEVQDYWIKFRGLMDCDERFTKAYQIAVLHYKGATTNTDSLELVDYFATERGGKQVNSLNEGKDSNNTILMSDLNTTNTADYMPRLNPDYRFYLAYDFYGIDNPVFHRSSLYGFQQVKEKLYTPQINYISMKLPSFPPLSQPYDIRPDSFCNETTVTNCDKKFCECTHVLEIPLNSEVEIILIDKGVTYDANHPFHLHGHAFRVVAMDRLGRNTTLEEVMDLDKRGFIPRKLVGAPLKDTVTVPDGGYTIVRFNASNPGYWLFHCHISFHVEIGMAVIFKVGDQKDFPPPPKGFPQCSRWQPDLGDFFDPYGIDSKTLTKCDFDTTHNYSHTGQVPDDSGIIWELHPLRSASHSNHAVQWLKFLIGLCVLCSCLAYC